jgi:hypothetical protein
MATDRIPVRRSVIVALAGLALAALLDAEGLAETAQRQPFGWRHDLATAVTEPLVDLSRALHLTAPRRWIEDALDRDHAGGDGDGDATVAVGTTTTIAGSSPASTDPPSSTRPTTTTTTTTTAPSRRRPTADAPLRVLVAGDSMTEAFGPAFLAAADSTGVIDADHELEYSSGLTRPDYFDWPAELVSLLAEHDPEVVILMLGANDAQGILATGGPAGFATEAWIAEYRARVAQTMTLLDADGRIVYWIGQPIMRSGSFDERMALITDIYRQEASRHAGVRFVETRELFSAEGAYSAYLPSSSGDPVLVRRDDGIHLTPAGGDRLAGAVLTTVGQDWAPG